MSQEKIKQTIKTTIIIGAILALICVTFHFLFLPGKRVSTSEILSREEARQPLQKENHQLRTLIQEQHVRINALLSHDSVLNDQLTRVEKQIRSLKQLNNEVTNQFNNHTSPDWARYFAELPDVEGQ